MAETGKPLVLFAKTDPRAELPRYESGGAAGADIRARIDHTITLKPGQRELVPTGLMMEIPEGYECQVRPRSGLAAKHGVTVLNSPGTIDSDYRGEVKVILINLGSDVFSINDGDRIAQLVFAPAVQVRISLAPELSESGRGSGAFGSTGISGSPA